MVGRLGANSWPTLARRVFLLALSTILVTGGLHAGFIRNVILLWDHAAGPFSYNVYEATNLSVTPLQWVLLTNTTALSVQLQGREGEHYFRVSCVNTNAGLESFLVAY